ncbi:hypothetical protein Tco_0216911 [Tanacetum coccineum]
MSNTNTNLPTQTSSVLHNDRVTSCSTSKVQEKTQLSRIDLVVIQNICSEKEDSNSETASSKSVKDSNLDSATKDVHAIKYKMSKAKAKCMAYFRSLHSHLQVLSKEDLKGNRIEHRFKWAFMSLFGQDADTFTSTMILNVDQLQKQLDKDEFQEDRSMAAFWVYFVKYTGIEVKHFKDTLLQHIESSGTESEVQDDSSRSGNDTDADDADIRPIYDEEPMAKVGLTNSGKVLGKLVLQSLRNQSVVRQLNAFKSERPQMSKPRFASQVDMNNNLLRPVTQHYFPKRRESYFAKPDHMIASSSSRNSSKNMPRFSSNDMVHNHYLEEAKKKTQERNKNSKSSVMHTVSPQTTTKGSKQKPRSNNQTTRSLPAFESSCVTSNVVPLILNIIGLRWVLKGKIFTSCTSKADSESTHGSKFSDMEDDVDINALTIEQYMDLIPNDIKPAIVNPKIGDDVEFKINANFMRELRRKLFAGTDDEVAY